MEKWEWIMGYEGLYMVSNTGFVRNAKGYILSPRKAKNGGQLRLQLYKQKKPRMFFVKYLVAETFLENTHNAVRVRHKDGNEMNNRTDNLVWVMAGTRKEELA